MQGWRGKVIRERVGAARLLEAWSQERVPALRTCSAGQTTFSGQPSFKRWRAAKSLQVARIQGKVKNRDAFTSSVPRWIK